jgi:hypothetical protein
MVVASAPSFPQTFFAALDELLLQTCGELQLAPARYDRAVERYGTLNSLLESSSSPFQYFRPEIYPQGSMALGTTVAPISGKPHDLDFVLQLSRDSTDVDPMGLIRGLYEFLRQHGTYRPMTTLKNRCVRIEYADEFYMDILPACLNAAVGGTCIRVPDRAAKGWSDSNPRGYIKWFKEKSQMLLVETLLERADPIPDQQAVAHKDVLQLVVQLSKRWRDVHYAEDPELAPISIVLTTLAGHTYRGERSVSLALTSMLNGVVELIDASQRAGEKHLRIFNPSNLAEDLSERWDSTPSAYDAFERGTRDFHRRWSQLIARQGGVDAELIALFGEPVTTVLRKRAQRLQESRLGRKSGVTSAGIITSSSAATVHVRPNTFHGAE